MEIQKLQQEYLFVSLPNTLSCFIRLKQLGDIWIFNCFEGCQHVLNKHRVKISQIKKIIITNNNIESVSGLLGLLSSISLNTQTTRIDVYAPEGLHNYIFWGRQYSQTNFRYELYIHNVVNGLIDYQVNFNTYAFYKHTTKKVINYTIIFSEQAGSLDFMNVISYNIPSGPLYGFFKTGTNFILPDGFIAYSRNFIHGYYLGSKLLFVSKYMEQDFLNLLAHYDFLLYH